MNKLLQNKLKYNLKKIKAIGIGLFASALSSDAPKESAKPIVIDVLPKISLNVADESIGIEHFFHKIVYDKELEEWLYKEINGETYRIKDIPTFETKDSLQYQQIFEKDLKVSFDTITVDKIMTEDSTLKNIYISAAKDTMQNLSVLGYYISNTIKINHFIPSKTLDKDTQEELSKFLSQYNNDLNCTFAHEHQHFINAQHGISRAGQSYENKFIECCADEISANLAQLLAQRQNYIKKQDINNITPQFGFYKEALKKGKFKPKDKVSTKELKFIAIGVLEKWVNKTYELYKKRNTNRTVSILSTTTFLGASENSARHEKLINKMLNVDGYDFAPFIKNRLDEIVIHEESKQIFAQERIKKEKKIPAIEKLKISKPENILASKINEPQPWWIHNKNLVK